LQLLLKAKNLVNNKLFKTQTTNNISNVQARGFYKLKELDLCYSFVLGLTNQTHGNRYVLKNMIRDLNLLFDTSTSQNGYQKVFEYQINDVYHIISRNMGNGTQNFVEYKFENSSFVATGRDFLSGVTNQGFYSGCWNGINCTEAHTSFALISKKSGGINKVDLFDMSIVATLARNECVFINIKTINDYAWYIRGSFIGRLKMSDMSFNEWNMGFTLFDIRFVGAKFDETDKKIFAAEYNGYRYVVVDMNDPDNFEIVDLSLELEGMLICGLSYLESNKTLFVHSYANGDVAGGYVCRTLKFNV